MPTYVALDEGKQEGIGLSDTSIFYVLILSIKSSFFWDNTNFDLLVCLNR